MNKNNNRKWQDYQKEIAEDDYYYARSCIRQNFFPVPKKHSYAYFGRCWVKTFMTIRTRLPVPALHTIRESYR